MNTKVTQKFTIAISLESEKSYLVFENSIDSIIKPFELLVFRQEGT